MLCRTLALALLGALIPCSSGLALNQRQRSSQRAAHKIQTAPAADDAAADGPLVAPDDAPSSSDYLHGDFADMHKRIKAIMDQLTDTRTSAQKAGQTSGHGLDAVEVEGEPSKPADESTTARKKAAHEDFHGMLERTKTMLENLNLGDLGKVGEGEGAHKDLFHGIDETMKKVFDANGGEFKDTLRRITENIDTEKLNESIRHFSKAAESIFRTPIKDAAKKRNEPESSNPLSPSVDAEGAQRTHGGEGIDDDSVSFFDPNFNFEEWFNIPDQDL